jgi:Interferon-induced transmembrane protein
MSFGNVPRPRPGYGQEAGYASGPPRSYLAWAIVATLFCCLPFGIVSIVFAAQVNAKWTAGDYGGAEDYSRRARNWFIASVVCGAIAIIVIAIIRVSAANNGAS